MTDKLPVVGKRYKIGIEIEIKAVFNNKIIFEAKDLERKSIFYDFATLIEDGLFSCELQSFFNYFEELPEDKAETECSVGKKSNCKRCEKEFLQHHRSDYYCSNYCKNMIAIKAKPETKKGATEQDNLYFQAGWKGAKKIFNKLSPEVKEAMELMQFQIDHHDKSYVTEVDPRFLPPILLKVLERAKNLLNALEKQFNLNGYFEGLPPSKETIDKQFMSKEEDKIDVKQKHVDSVKVNETSKSVDVKGEEVKEKEESIWKPVSELPEDGCSVIIKHRYGGISFAEYRIKSGDRFLTFGDSPFIQQNIMQYCILTDFINDYEKLKERVKKLEGVK